MNIITFLISSSSSSQYFQLLGGPKAESIVTIEAVGVLSEIQFSFESGLT